MFRNSKSDQDNEGRPPVEDRAGLSSALDGRASAVASSALRWLGRSPKTDTSVDDDADDDLELTNLIGIDESGKDGDESGKDDSAAGDQDDAQQNQEQDAAPASDLDDHDQAVGIEPEEEDDDEVELSTTDRIDAEDVMPDRSPTDEMDARPTEPEPAPPVETVVEARVTRPAPNPAPEASKPISVNRASVGQTAVSGAPHHRPSGHRISGQMSYGAEFFDYDDDDDFDDVDDLNDIANIIPPAAFNVETMPEDLAPESAHPEEHVDQTAAYAAPPSPPPSEAIEDVPSRQDHEGQRIEPAQDRTEPDRSTLDIEPPSHDIEPAAHEPVQQDAVEADPTPTEPVSETSGSHARRAELEEAPAPAPLDTSLALQPIPELQTGSRSPRRRAPSSSEPAASAPAVGDTEMSGEDGDGIDASSDDPEQIGSSEIEASDLDDIDLDQLDSTSADQTDERIDDDWHAHLAEVLCDDGKQPKDEPAEVTRKQANDEKNRPAVLALSKPARPKPIVPKPVVTKPVAKLAATSTAADDEDDVPVPPILTRPLRQQPLAGEAVSAGSGETDSLSPEQLSIGIVANVQRLRRFATVQIGDEVVADQLVQTTVESALAECPSCPKDGDLGLALMMLLYRRRREMAIDPDAPQPSFETIRDFETFLCRGLSGADQFEIHAFAQAMNELDEQDRELLVLIALENLSYEQIGEIIRIPTQQVMNRLANARLSLRQALSTHNPGLSEKTSRIDTPHGREIEIHGYLDGELDGHHMADVDALVEYDEDAADRLLHYGIQGDLIRRLYAPLINRPIPHRMLAALAIAAKPVRRGFRFGSRRAMIAGGVLALLVGTAAAWTYIEPALNGVVPDAMAVSTAAIDVDH